MGVVSETVDIWKRTMWLKPDFHSHPLPIAREIFRMERAQSDRTNRIRRENIFHILCI